MLAYAEILKGDEVNEETTVKRCMASLRCNQKVGKAVPGRGVGARFCSAVSDGSTLPLRVEVHSR